MYSQILDGLGDRPLGLEADQLIEIARWIKGRAGVGKLRLKASGISRQAAATVAAALKPDFLAHVVVHSGMPSLRFVLDAPLNFQERLTCSASIFIRTSISTAWLPCSRPPR